MAELLVTDAEVSAYSALARKKISFEIVMYGTKKN
jgi:hypothetical protein